MTRQRPGHLLVSYRLERAKRWHHKTLDLSGRGLRELPPGIGQLTAVTTLNISNNRLAELCQLTSLQQLIAGNNQLAELPTRIGRLKRLRKLDISNNKITALPAGLAAIAQLSELNLRSNLIVEFPEVVCDLVNLTCLIVLAIVFSQDSTVLN
jgi:Leucine-rich repeat (LRR) protein